MKRILTIVFIVVCSIMLLTSCKGTFDKNKNDGSDSTSPGEVDLSGIRFEDLTTDYSGSVKHISVKGNIPVGVTVKYDGNDRTDAGEYTVTAKFYLNGVYLEGKDLSAVLTIRKATYDMSGVKFPSVSFDYTGNSYTPSITGELPDGVTVEYVYDGEIKNAGIYTVVAKFTGDSNHESISDMTANYTVNKADYDMSGIKFENSTVEYDGEAHSIFISGTLPAGVTVEYVGNDKTLVGEHEVRAVFTSSDLNYKTPKTMVATLTILPEAVKAVELIYELKSDNTFEVVGYSGDNPHVIIPATYNGKPVTSVRSSAFEGNENIVYAIISYKVTNIGNKAFSGCTSLVSVSLGNGVEVIGYKAFANTSVTEVVLPDSLVSMGQGAFADTKLESITLPFIGGSRVSSNAYLGYIFGASYYSGNAAVIPSTLKSVIISDAATEIPAYAFFGASSIEEIIVGKNVSYIGNSAFYGTSISSIYLPASVNEIPADAMPSNSPFFGLQDDFIIVLERTATEKFGQYWNYLSESKSAISVPMKTYKFYLENLESLRVADPASADLTSILIASTPISDFDANTYDYSGTADINSGYPIVTVAASSAIAKVTIRQATAANGGVATITVVSADLSVTKTYRVTFNVTGTFSTSAEIVNKDGADGAVSFVIDDGIEQTATLTLQLLNKYKDLKLTYAIITNRIATLKTETVNGAVNYVMLDGKYVYTVQADKILFWKNILSGAGGRAELISHTHSHAFWGTNDDGGVFEYVDSQGNLLTSSNLPVGSATAEILASNQILMEQFGSSGLTHVVPGIMVKTEDVVIGDKTIPTYNTYYQKVLADCIEDGTLAGIRGNTFGATANYTGYVTTKNNIARMGVRSLMIRATDDPESWCNYIDKAEKMNGLAVFCIHQIIPDGTSGSGHYVYQSFAEEMFSHALEKNLWIANYTEATLYFTEWSTASVEAVYEDGMIKVTLIDEEDDSIFNEPLTVKISVPATWTSAQLNGEILAVHKDASGNRFVYANIVPDSGVQYITAA